MSGTVAQALARAGQGEPLPPAARQRLETAFGYRLEQLRIHDDEQSHAAAEALAAQAFTRGRDIWFGHGQFAPGSGAGDRLLVHEISHVVQPSQPRGELLAPRDSPAEATAYAGESRLLTRLGGPAPAHLRPLPPPQAMALHRRQPAADPAPAVAPEIEMLLADIDAAKPGDEVAAALLLERAASTEPLANTVDRLDNEGLIDELLDRLGSQAWGDPAARSAMLMLLPLRDPERNAATIAHQTATGLLTLDLRISGEESRAVYELLRALPVEARALLLTSDEAQLAFERMPQHHRPALRLAKQLAFLDEDLDALLVELADPAVWAPEQEAWLRTLIWMAAQAGQTTDPRVTQLVRDHWDRFGDLFAELGLRADASPVGQELKAMPEGAGLLWRGSWLALTSDPGGALGTGLRAFTRTWGAKTRRVDNIRLDRLQKTLRGTLFGVHLDGFEGRLVTGELAVEVNPRRGVLGIELPAAKIPTLSWRGGPLAVTARDVSLEGLRASASWSTPKTAAGLETMRLDLEKLVLAGLTATRGREVTAGLAGVVAGGLHLDIALGPFSEGEPSPITKVTEHLNDAMGKFALALHALLGVIVSTVATGPQESTAALASLLHEKLTEELGGELMIAGHVGSLEVGAAEAAGAGRAGLAGAGLDIAIVAGPHALAELEMMRLTNKEGELTKQEQDRIAELQRMRSEPDRAATEAAARSLGLDPDDLVVRIDSRAPGGLVLQGIELPAAQVHADTLIGEGVALTVTVPDAVVPPQALVRAGERPLLTVELDVAEGRMPGSAGTQVAGRPVAVEAAEFSDLHAKATTLADGRVRLEAVVAQVGCDTLAWGDLTIAAAGGVATALTIQGLAERDESGRYAVAAGETVAVDIVKLAAPSATLSKPGVYQATLEQPLIFGVHAELKPGSRLGLVVASGQVAGLDGLLAGLLRAKSGEPMSFGVLSAEIDVGGYRFTLADLDARNVDLDAAGNRVSIQHFDGPIAGRFDDQGHFSARIEGGRVELGAVQLSLPWIELSASAAAMPSFTAEIEARVEPGSEALPGHASATLKSVAAPTVEVEGLEFELPALGLRGRLPGQKGALIGLAVTDVGLELGAAGLRIEGGQAIAAGAHLQAVEVWLGDVAFARADADSGRLALEFVADGSGVRLGADNVTLDAEGHVTVQGGGPGSFVVESFEAAHLDAELTDLGASATVAAGRLVLGPLDFDYAGVKVRCRHATAADVSLSVRAAADPAGAEPLRVTLVAAEAPLVHVEGLEFEVAALGVRGQLLDHPGVLGHLRVQGVEAELGAQGFTLTGGHVSLANAEAGGLEAQLGKLLSGRANLGTGAITVDFFGDQRVHFSAEDLTVEADGTISVPGADAGHFVLTAGKVASLDVDLAPGSVEGEARGIELGPGWYDDGNLRIAFANMVVDAALSHGKVTLPPLPPLLSPDLASVMQARGIGTLHGIDLANAKLLVRDVGRLPGALPIGTAHVDALKALAAGASGQVGFRLVGAENFFRTRLDATANDGRARGTLTDTWTGIFPVNPFPKTIAFEAELADLIQGSQSLLSEVARVLAPYVPDATRDEFLRVLLTKTEVLDFDARLAVRIDSIPFGSLGRLEAVPQTVPQVDLIVTGSSAGGLGIEFSLGAASLKAVAWSRFVAKMDGVLIDAGDVKVSFDGVIPKRLEATIRIGRIDALQLFGAPAAGAAPAPSGPSGP